MCRLFGFRSVIQSQVHSSLVSADNALQMQGSLHPDGWGVAYYVAGAPHVIKSRESAVNDHIFTKVSGVVSSQTVVAHIRKATLGNKNILNTHPFQYGHWVFAHNGNIKNFSKHKNELLIRVLPELRRFILGDTDSEIIFYFILSHLSNYMDLGDKQLDYPLLAKSVNESMLELVKIIGDYSPVNDAGSSETYLSFILTNGSVMLAHQGGKHLYWSTYKQRCFDRDTCPSFAPECEAKTLTHYVNHLLFTSEPLKGDNVWTPMSNGQIIGVDAHMKLFNSHEDV